MRNIRVRMQDTKIIFEDEQNGVKEEIYDFMSALRNVSAFPLQKQLDLLIAFMQGCQQKNTPVHIQMVYMMLVGMVYDYLEPISKPVHILHIGKDEMYDFLKRASASFHERNCLHSVGRGAELQGLRSDYFNLVLYHVLPEHDDFGTVYKEMTRILSEEAVVILYGHEGATEEMLQTYSHTPGKFFDFEEMGFVVYLKPEKICEESREYKETINQAKRLNESLRKEINELWNAGNVNKNAMEKALRKNMDLERFVNEQRDIFRNENIKYYCNEVKNAIMDLYYEVSVRGEETGYFYKQVKQCQGEWESQIY